MSFNNEIHSDEFASDYEEMRDLLAEISASRYDGLMGDESHLDDERYDYYGFDENDYDDALHDDIYGDDLHQDEYFSDGF